ncbi:MAG: helix-turn-helix domain-containing protein [Myxococcota bacterium]
MNVLRRGAVDRIVELVAVAYELEPTAILKHDRHKCVVEARHLCYWLARRTTRFSWPELARAFRDPSSEAARDHTTIMNGANSNEARMRRDRWLRETASRLLEVLVVGDVEEAFSSLGAPAEGGFQLQEGRLQ